MDSHARQSGRRGHTCTCTCTCTGSASAVVVHTHATDDAIDTVAVTAGIRLALEQEHPDAVTLNSLINAHAKVGDVNKAYRSAKLMRKYGVAPTLVTYNTLLDGCARAGNLTLARQTLHDMRAQQNKSSLGFLNPFIYSNMNAFNDVVNGTNRGPRLRPLFCRAATNAGWC